ncbi:hypothetical protein [Leifsonia aquatica]|uniref:hypothetical protein n=1 Tax=Leifsonia aquatica TaxID=144185 RepID=UPI0028ABB145|nr:hypothetical protein [Leifsonia aquatica]
MSLAPAAFANISVICPLTGESYTASTRREFADALAQAGHYGVARRGCSRLLEFDTPVDFSIA